MTWILWASMLLTHGAFSRWAESLCGRALIRFLGDVLLMVIALLTIDHLQGMDLLDYGRTGLFFIAFATAGRQLMHSVMLVPRTGRA